MRMFSLTVLLALLCGIASSQTEYQFEPIFFGLPAPEARIDSTLIYDPEGREVFVFGGRGTVPLNDLWAYSIERGFWRQVQPFGIVPPARFGHTMVFDPARRRLVIFGGQANIFLDDVWAYDIAGNRWTELRGGGLLPNRRYGHSAVVDAARDRMVMSHGFTDRGRFDDTWVFDFLTDRWMQITPPIRPERRCLHHAVYDAARDQMLLFGGCAGPAGPCPLDDLWAFDLSLQRWTRLAGGPPARQFYGTAFDADEDRMIVFGGDGRLGRLNDVWEYDPESNQWAATVVNGFPPPARSNHSGAYIPGNGLVFFGGQTIGGVTNELWRMTAIPRPKISAAGVANAFNFDTGGVAPGEIVSIFLENGGPVEGVASQFGEDGVLPFELAGVTVTWNGMPSPLFFVSDRQINAQVPYEKSMDTEVDLVVTNAGQSSDTVRLPVVAAKAGLFGTVFNQDGTINSESNPAAPGSVIVMFLSGQGVTSPASVTGAFPMDGFPRPVAAVSVTVGGEAAEVLFDGQAPFTAGVLQLNARLGAVVGAQPVEVTIGAASNSNEVIVWVQAP